jgi:hypothetical protein
LGRWSLEAARAIFPDVRERTARAASEAESAMARREQAEPGTPEHEAAGREVEALVSRWAREMEALGLVVKGPWLVDFDTGAGYYCWKWPEEALDHFHGYEDGFAGRVRIQ